MFKLEDCLAYLASRHSKELAAILEKKLSETGITRVQWMALYHIHENRDITQKELAELLGSKEPTVVRLIDRMEKEDLVARIHLDRRTNAIELTEKGNTVYEEGLVIAEQFKNDALRDIPEEYMEQFIWVLNKMIENTEEKQQRS